MIQDAIMPDFMLKVGSTELANNKSAKLTEASFSEIRKQKCHHFLATVYSGYQP